MRGILIGSFALLLPLAAAAETRLVTLKSGEEIYGEVVEAQGALKITTISGKKRTVKAGDVESVQSLNGSRAPIGRDERLSVLPAPGASKPSDTPTLTLEAAPSGEPLDPELGALQMGEISALQTRIMADPKMMELLLNMAQDPQLMAAVRDPRLLAAIKAGDVAALQRDPNLAKVANDPRVRALMDQLKRER